MENLNIKETEQSRDNGGKASVVEIIELKQQEAPIAPRMGILRLIVLAFLWLCWIPMICILITWDVSNTFILIVAYIYASFLYSNSIWFPCSMLLSIYINLLTNSIKLKKTLD